MNAYNTLAASYDRLTNDVEYREVVEFYWALLTRENIQPRTAVDLACGTGSVALLLAEKGLQVTGVDMSPDMLCMAAQKADGVENRPVFVCQRLQELCLPKAVDLAVCALDSLDYITDPDGCFIFDVNTPEKLRAMDGQIFLDEDDDVYCVWRGEFDEKTNICTYWMDLFQRRGKVWDRSFEEHREYAYTPQQLTGYLKHAGFTGIEVFGDRRLTPPEPGEQRIYLKARKGKIK